MRARIGNRYRLRLLFLLPPGVAASAFIVWNAGPHAVTASLLAVGLRGLFAGAAVHLAAVACCAFAWGLLAFPRARRPPWRFFLLGRLVRDVLGEMLPAVPLGEVLAIRELVRAGMSAVRATAATIGDITVELGTQLACAAFLSALVAAAGLPSWRGLAVSAIAGAGLPLAACVLAQTLGGVTLSRLLGSGARLLARISGFWNGVEAGLRRLYGHWPRLVAAAAIHLAAWILGGLETWVLLHFAGVAAGPLQALALEIAVCGVRNVSPVPGSAGVQEGGYFLLGSVIGLAPEAAVALSLAKRARSLLCAVLLVPLWSLVRAGEEPAVARRRRAAILREGSAVRWAGGGR